MNPLRSLQAKALASYLRAVHATSSLRVEGLPSQSSLSPIWHESLLLGTALAVDRPNVAVYVLESLVTEAILTTIERAGLSLIRARPDNAYGVRAVRDWVRRNNHHVVITLDGPSGPRRLCKPGVARLARLSGVPLYPLHLSTSQGFELNSWDRCVVPDLFSHLSARFVGRIDGNGRPREVARTIESTLLAASQAASDRPRNRLRNEPFRAWARACFAPLQFGSLRVGVEALSPTSRD